MTNRNPSTKTESVPRSALCFAGDYLQAESPPVAPADGGATLYPFSMTARTGGLANHPWWGPCVHDFAGMLPGKSRVSVDYCHEAEEVIGYADAVAPEADGLKLSGALVSVSPGDRAAEIFAKAKAGIPYETSILTNAAGLIVEHISEGMETTVNGQTFSGPLTVFREWELWGVAILPYGSDPKTQVAFGAGETVNVQVTYGAPAVTNPTPSTAPAKTGAEYMQRFGQERGALWFAQGESWEESLQKFEGEIVSDSAKKDEEIAALKEELTQMKGKYEALMTETENVKAENSGLKRGTDPLTSTTPTPGTTPAAPSKFAGLGKAAGFAEATERKLRERGLIGNN